MKIQKATDSDLPAALAVEQAAFGSNVEGELVRNLLEDPSAQPALSLLAFIDDEPVGHVLFTRLRLDPAPSLKLSILAPLAVVPAKQKQGIGSALVKHGLQVLTRDGTDLVFVLGHIEYYPRLGFKPAGPQGLIAPYPIPEKVADAWMVQELRPGVLGKYKGTVTCADAMDRPEYWRDE